MHKQSRSHSELRRRRRIVTIVWSVAALALPAVFLAFFFVWPVAAMIGRGVTPPEGSEGTWWGPLVAVLFDGWTWRLIAQTLGLALGGTLGSIVLGLFGAHILSTRSFRGRGVIRAVATIPFVLPTVVVGVAFRALLAENGPLGFLGLDQTTAAVILAMIFFNFSVVVRQVGAVWADLDPRQAEAARTLGASRLRAFLTVTLPALKPSIWSAASLIFLYCSTAYGLMMTLGKPGFGTLETEIYIQTETFLDLPQAAALSILQLAIVLASLAVSQRARSKSETALRLSQPRLRPLTRADWFSAIIAFGTVTALIVAPLLALLLRSFSTPHGWSLNNYRLLATSSGTGFGGGSTPLETLRNSLLTASDAMWITLIAGLPLAWWLSRHARTAAFGRAQKIVDAAVMLPVGVSGVTIGFGFIVSLQIAFPELARSGSLVPFAQAVVALPVVVRMIIPILRSVDPKLREAAATLGASPLRVALTVDGPMVARGIGFAAGLSFAIALGEFGATSFLASADFQTLPVTIVRLMNRPGADNYGMGMAASVILALVAATAMAVCEWLAERSTRSAKLASTSARRGTVPQAAVPQVAVRRSADTAPAQED